MNKMLFKKTLFFFVVVMCASCGTSKKMDESSSIWEVHTFCIEKLYGKNKTPNCFSERTENQDWEHYGNAIFALYNNRMDVFDQELGKIPDKKSGWYLAGKIEEAFFKKNFVKVKLYLNALKSSDSDKKDIFLLEYEAIALAREGYWQDLEVFLDKVPEDKILSGVDLPILLSFIYFNNGKSGDVLALAEQLRKKENEVSEPIYMDYLLHMGDEGKARTLYEKTNDASVAMKYGFYLFETGRTEEAKNIILSTLEKDKNAVDRVVPTAIYMMRSGFFDFAKEIMEKHFKITEEFYDAHWKDSSDYYLYPAWWLFIDGNFPEAEAKLAESLKLAPRDYDVNYLRFHLCTMRKDHACQQDAVNILLEHAPNDHNVLQLQEIAREDAESAAK